MARANDTVRFVDVDEARLQPAGLAPFAAPMNLRAGHVLVWTGEAILVWGGVESLPPDESDIVDHGALYNPSADQWSVPANIAGAGAPTPIIHAAAVWIPAM